MQRRGYERVLESHVSKVDDPQGCVTCEYFFFHLETQGVMMTGFERVSMKQGLDAGHSYGNLDVGT